MAFSPLWSCCFGPVRRHASNAEAENNFAQIKAGRICGELRTEGGFCKDRFAEIKNEICAIV